MDTVGEGATAILNRIVNEAVSFKRNLKKVKSLFVCMKLRKSIPG